MKRIIFLSILLLAFPTFVEARGHEGHGGHSGGHSSSHSSSSGHSHGSGAGGHGGHSGGHSSSRSSSSGHVHSSRSHSVHIRSSHLRSSKVYSKTSSNNHKSNFAAGAKRDSHGKIARNEEAKKEFMKQTGYPNGRPGYVVDHIVPLKRGGADTPSNMQWQTKDAAKAKDKWE